MRNPTSSRKDVCSIDFNQRLQCLAALFAEGVRRHRKFARRCDADKVSGDLGNSIGTCLEAPGETRLSGSRFRG